MSTQPLTDAERLAYVEIYAGAHNTHHSMLRIKPGAMCGQCEATARAVVAIGRDSLFKQAAELPPAEAEALDARPLTAAEEAAARALVGPGGRVEWAADDARAVVAAVRSKIEADVLDALADAAADYGPPSVDHLRGIAFIARQGRSTVDWLAESALSRPTPEEH